MPGFDACNKERVGVIKPYPSFEHTLGMFVEVYFAHACPILPYRNCSHT